MSDLTDVVSSFYDRLVVRDFLGKVVPGSVVVVAAYVACLSPVPFRATAINHLAQAPVGAWIVLASIGWFVGVALQAAGEMLRIIRYYPREVTPEQFMRGLLTIHDAAPGARQAHERYVVIKEATGNAAVAILVAAALVGLRIWCGEPLGRGWLALFALSAFAALLRMHWLQIDRQAQWANAVAEHLNKTKKSAE